MRGVRRLKMPSSSSPVRIAFVGQTLRHRSHLRPLATTALYGVVSGAFASEVGALYVIGALLAGVPMTATTERPAPRISRLTIMRNTMSTQARRPTSTASVKMPDVGCCRAFSMRVGWDKLPYGSDYGVEHRAFAFGVSGHGLS